MSEISKVRVAVALVMPEPGKVLLAWNQPWQAFTLPMTKISLVPPAEESPTDAAIRAAAEALRVPIRVVAGKSLQTTRELRLSDRDGVIRDYLYSVVPVEPHPDFGPAARACPGTFLVSLAQVDANEYQPLSPSVKCVMNECRAWGWL